MSDSNTSTRGWRTPTRHALSFAGATPVISLGGQQFALDTGSPVSTVAATPARLADGGACMTDRPDLRDLSDGQRRDGLSRRFDARVDGVLGHDVLSKLPFTICRSGGQVEFTRTGARGAGVTRLPLLTDGHVTALSVKIDGRRRLLLFDTGEPHTYLQEDLLQRSGPALGTIKGATACAGAFEAPLYQARLQIGERASMIHVAAAPSALDDQLLLNGLDGLTGLSLFAAYDRITIDTPRGNLFLSGYREAA